MNAASQPAPVGYGQVPAIGVLVLGLIITFVAAAFVRDWEVRERRHSVAQVSAGHVEALNGELIRSMEALYAIESLFNARNVAKPFRADQIYMCVAGLLDVSFEVQSTRWASGGAAAIDRGDMTLPEALASRLKGAAELHSATAVRGCLGELEDLGPNGRHLAEHLRGILASYDMEGIQRIVSALPVASAAGA